MKSCGIPLRPGPQFVERVWGAPRDSGEIAQFYSPAPGRPQRIGEVWLTGNENRIANGPHAGKTLRQVTGECGETLLGSAAPMHPSGVTVFPLLVKFLFTRDKLSVQVHPSDKLAKGLGSWGKTEMWHILRAAPGARLAVGFRQDIPPETLSETSKLRDAARTGAIEQMLEWTEVCAGETYFIPAGSVHAIGAGIVLCEIQQNSDVTYRLYDYNRLGTDGKPRPLHVEEALEVTNPRSVAGRTAPYDCSIGTTGRQLLAACPYFATERWDLWETAEGVTGEHLEIWITLRGSAVFEARGTCEKVHAGEAIILPVVTGSFSIRPDGKSVFLRTYRPDWQRDVVEPLRAAGKSPEHLRRTCFPMCTTGQGDAE